MRKKMLLFWNAEAVVSHIGPSRLLQTTAAEIFLISYLHDFMERIESPQVTCPSTPTSMYHPRLLKHASKDGNVPPAVRS